MSKVMYNEEKIINEIVDFLKKDRGVKKHRVGEIRVNRISETQDFPELVIQWDSNNFATAKPVMNRIYEVYGDVVPSVGFYHGYTSHIHIPLKRNVIMT